MTTKTSDHEHDWQLVQKQIIYEGFDIESMEFEGDESLQVMFVKPDDSEVKWQDVAELIDQAITCKTCDIEYPYPEGGWEVSWY